jgi:hypothetical protein
MIGLKYSNTCSWYQNVKQVLHTLLRFRLASGAVCALSGWLLEQCVLYHAGFWSSVCFIMLASGAVCALSCWLLEQCVLYHAGFVTHCHGAHLLLPDARNSQDPGARNESAGRELHAAWVARGVPHTGADWFRLESGFRYWNSVRRNPLNLLFCRRVNC